MVKISELNDGDRNVNIEGTIVKMEEPRDVVTRFGRTKVANATIEDDSDRIALTLWGDDADKVKEGKKVRITNGYVKTWNGEKQVSVGKFGKIEAVEE